MTYRTQLLAYIYSHSSFFLLLVYLLKSSPLSLSTTASLFFSLSLSYPLLHIFTFLSYRYLLLQTDMAACGTQVRPAKKRQDYPRAVDLDGLDVLGDGQFSIHLSYVVLVYLIFSYLIISHILYHLFRCALFFLLVSCSHLTTRIFYSFLVLLSCY